MNEIAPLWKQHMRPDRVAECEVMLNEIEVMADIGAYAAEQGVLQPLRIGVALSIIPPASDDLTQTFDYALLIAYARELAAQRISLIETFALRLAEMCLASAIVMEAVVRVDKPLAVPGCLAGTRIKLRKAFPET